MITNADLKSQTRRDLADAAREIGVTGWHSMRKDELIDAIRKAQRSSRRKTSGKKSTPGEPATKQSSAAKPNRSGKARGSKAAGNDQRKRGEQSKAEKSSTSKRPTAKTQPRKSATGKPAADKSTATKSGTAAKSTKSTKTLKSVSGRGAASGQSEPVTADNGTRKPTARKPREKGKPTATANPNTSVKSPSAGQADAGQRTSSAATAEKSASGTPSPRRSRKSRSKAPQRAPTAPQIVKVVRKQQADAEARKDLSACVRVKAAATGGGGAEVREKPDRIVLIVRDSYWLQATWEVSRGSVERARAAMGADWHAAEPMLRLAEVGHGSSVNSAEQLVRDIPVHGGVNNWYIDVENPPGRFRVLIGYRAKSGRFHTLCRSNIVHTPAPGACDPIDGHWQDIAEDYERIYSLSENDNGTSSNDLREMFEERLQRPMIDLSGDNFIGGSDFPFRRERELPFEVDAELIVYGSTTPGSTVTLAGKPVKLSADGSFTVRMELPDKRQVIPVVACSRDGMRQRTTVVAVERNTKVMEPVSRTSMD
ncbi:DUF4912 domain-containing protein [Planctomycetaceae bacterium SH139]